MSTDFLTTLAARTLGLTPVIEPAIASLFASQFLITSEYAAALNYEVESLKSETLPNFQFPISNQSMSSSLVPGGNSVGAISRLPYSQILATAPNIELDEQEQVDISLSSPINSQSITENPSPINPVSFPPLSSNRPQLQREEQVITSPAESLYDNIDIEPIIYNQNPLENRAPESNLITPPVIQDIVQRKVDAATPLSPQSLPTPSLYVESSEYLTPIIEPLINQIDLSSQIPNQQYFDSQSPEFFNSKEQPNFRQQNIDVEITNSTVDVSQWETTATPTIIPVNAMTPIVSPRENQSPLVSQVEDKPDFQSSPTIIPVNAVTPIVSPRENQSPLVSQVEDKPDFQSSPTIIPANTVTPIVSPRENQSPLISQVEDKPDFQSSPTIIPANAVTQIVSPRENQSPLVSQVEDKPNVQSSPTIIPVNAVTQIVSPRENQSPLVSQVEDKPNVQSSPTIIPVNAVTPIVSPWENQSPLISQVEDKPDFQSSPTIIPANAMTPIVSPRENQSPLVSQVEDKPNVQSSPTIIPVNAVTPIVSPRENQPSLVSQVEDKPNAQSSPAIIPVNAVTPIVSPRENQSSLISHAEDKPDAQSSPTIIPVNVVTPIVSPRENQSPLVSQVEDKPDFPSSPTIIPANPVTPIVSPRENQSPLVSQVEDKPDFPSSPTIIPANPVTPIVSPRENQSPLVSQVEDKPDFQSSPTIIPVNAVTPIISPRENQPSLVSQQKDDSEKVTHTVAVSKSLVETDIVSNIIPPNQRQISQYTSPVSTAIPKSVINTLQQSLPTKSDFSPPLPDYQPANSPTALTPLVDKPMLRSDRYSEAREFETRLPSSMIINQNGTKIKPLVVMSPERSPDLEKATQLASKRELEKTDPPPTVTVTIGRIEVRAAPTTPTSKKKPTPHQPSVSLQDYLKERQGGKV